MMDINDIQTYIKELYGTTGGSGSQREVSILETALFVEEVFDIKLSDAEICAENLGNYERLVEFVGQKRRD